LSWSWEPGWQGCAARPCFEDAGLAVRVLKASDARRGPDPHRPPLCWRDSAPTSGAGQLPAGGGDAGRLGAAPAQLRRAGSAGRGGAVRCGL